MKYSLLTLLLFALVLGCRDSGTKKNADPDVADTAVDDPAKPAMSPDAYREKGMEYAMAVQGALGKTLQAKIQEEGIREAVVFCHVEALPITDSLSEKLGARISRITDKPRNPLNSAGAEEMKFISNFRAELAGGQTPEALVVRQGEHTTFYYPILTNNLCLKCHGTPGEDIVPDLLSTISELYPEDQATGYSASQLRGLWKVTFTE